ncbi:hypothetical protein GCM10023144_01370 [Pigmentiphaga soli]|uniref:Uncharacterized protein n=1 Tax=Pigmentiphaga soli TaxID=1007095 RepID=A0ABP8GCK0_9BURK
MNVFHGSSAPITEIRADGVFGGLFATPSRKAALSHGDVLHVMEIDDARVLTQHALSYELDYDTVLAALRNAAHWVDADDLDRAWELVIEDAQADGDDARILRVDDAGEAGWEAQRLRGVVARALGYAAVEMSDEHGTTYLVLPGAAIRMADEQG